MNSQEFTDEPEDRSRPTRSQSRFCVSRSRGLSMHPFGVTTWPRGGWAGSRIAVGAEIVRFTGAFLRGRRFFSSLDVAIQSPIFLVVPSGGATRRRHLLSQQPRDLDFSFLAERRFPSGDVFRSYRADCFFREGKLPSLLGRLDGGVSFILPSSLVFPVYRWRQDSSRGLPFDLSYGFGKLSRGSGTDFSVYGVGFLPTRDFDEVR